MSNTVRIGDLVVFKASGLWVVRHFNQHKDLAHEATKADALAVARKLNKGA